MYIWIGGGLQTAWLALLVAALVGIFIWLSPAEPLIGRPAYDRSAEGQITQVEETDTKILERRVWAVTASFLDDDGERHVVRSFETSHAPRAVDAWVIVRYQRADPGRAVIDGMRTHATPYWMKPVFVATALAMTALVVGLGLPWRRRALALLRHGIHTTGTITEVRKRGRGKRAELVATVAFTTADGHSHQIEDESYNDGFFEVGAREPLVYDPDSPERATLLRTLPGKPVIDGNETVRFG